MAGQLTNMICIECGHKFKKIISAHAIEVQCPNCKGVDTEVV